MQMIPSLLERVELWIKRSKINLPSISIHNGEKSADIRYWIVNQCNSKFEVDFLLSDILPIFEFCN